MTRLGFYIIHNNRYKLIKTVEVPWDFTTNQPDDDSIVTGPNIGEWDPMKYVLHPDNIAYEDEYQIVVKKRVELALSEQKAIEKLYRVTYGDTGIFDAVRRYMSPKKWEEFLNNENVNWLYKPDIYEDKDSTYRSYFTEVGYEQFKEKTLPLILNIFAEEDITTELLEVVRGAETSIEDSIGSDESNEESKPAFENWITQYFYNTLFKEKDFFGVFNTDKTYIIIAQENNSVMGFMITYKGRTIVNFEEHDYCNIVNAMYSDIRDAMILPDDSFGGHDNDSSFSQDKDILDDSFGGFDEDNDFEISEIKGINTYPNMF